MINFIHKQLKLHSMTSRFFFWLYLLMFLSSSLFLTAFVLIDKNQVINRTIENLKYNLLNQQLIIENWAEERAEEIRLLANSSVTKETDLRVMSIRFQYYTENYSQVDSIVYVDKDGYVKIDTLAKNPIITNSKITLKDRDYFIAAERGEEFMNDIVISRSAGIPATIFSAPVMTEDGQFNGLVFSGVTLSTLNQLLLKSIQSTTGEIKLISDEGVIISHLSKQGELTTKEEALNDKVSDHYLTVLNEADDSGYEYINEKNEKILGVVQPLFDGRYFLVHELKKNDVLKSHNQIIILIIVATLLITALTSILVVPVVKLIIHPLIDLVGAINQLKSHKNGVQLAEEKFVNSPIELKRIMKEFNEMSLAIKEHNEYLQTMSSIDPLTKIANRRMFDEELATTWEKANKDTEPISLIFIDIDYFKKFNDNFGHQAGDKCLIKVAQGINELILGTSYTFARYGGEEFIIILNNTNSEQAVEVAEQVRAKVKSLKIKRSLTADDEYVSISLGVATVNNAVNESKENLIQLADQAVYEAKSRGRDTVVVKSI